MSMVAKDELPTLAELDAHKHTVTEVDGHLDFLATSLKYGNKSNRKNCLKRIDYWLDIRIELTKDK